jgi:hypothetical protein
MNPSLEKAIRDLLLERLLTQGAAEIPRIGSFRLIHTPPQIVHTPPKVTSGPEKQSESTKSDPLQQLLTPPSDRIEFQPDTGMSSKERKST